MHRSLGDINLNWGMDAMSKNNGPVTGMSSLGMCFQIWNAFKVSVSDFKSSFSFSLDYMGKRSRSPSRRYGESERPSRPSSRYEVKREKDEDRRATRSQSPNEKGSHRRRRDRSRSLDSDRKDKK